MKIIKVLAIISIMSGGSIYAMTNDYAITDNYQLLNDMKVAKKQKELLVNMNRAIKSNNIKLIKDYKDKFTRNIRGLTEGDKKLNLQGTDIPSIKTRLIEVKNLWEKDILCRLRNIELKKNRNGIIKRLDSLITKMSQTVKQYDKSYQKFKQKSKFASLVAHHINTTKKRTFAFNVVQ